MKLPLRATALAVSLLTSGQAMAEFNDVDRRASYCSGFSGPFITASAREPRGCEGLPRPQCATLMQTSTTAREKWVASNGKAEAYLNSRRAAHNQQSAAEGEKFRKQAIASYESGMLDAISFMAATGNLIKQCSAKATDGACLREQQGDDYKVLLSRIDECRDDASWLPQP